MDFKILVKLKMKKSYKIPLTIIGLLILISLSIGVIYYSFDYLFSKDTDIDVLGNLSIYYKTGKSFKLNSDDTIMFDITNSSDKPSYFSISILKLVGSAHYKLSDENGIITEGEFNKPNEQDLIDISLDGNTVKNYKMEFTNVSDNGISGTIKVRTLETKNITFGELIIKNNPPSDSAVTKVGSEVAIEDEGLIKDSDDLGVTYYFRGNTNNNYVTFDDLNWRIVRINGDGTVRLVLDGLTGTVANYYTEENKSFNYNESEMHNYLEMWYEDNIKSKDNIANTKYCNDITHDDEFITNSYSRIITNNIPTFNCLSNVYSGHIGLLTIDEVIKAGSSNSNILNKNYYLYNSNINTPWYTMSSAKENDSQINMFMINENGTVNTNIVGNLYRGVRPVINLIKNIEMKGTGTLTDPYMVVNNE